MMTWLRKLMRRRPAPAAAPTVHPETLDQARKQHDRATEALLWVEAQDQEVNARTERAARIRRENNLGPAFMRVLKGDHDAAGPA
jgi:hypothetical protein